MVRKEKTGEEMSWKNKREWLKSGRFQIEIVSGWLKWVAEEVVDWPLRSGRRRLFGVGWRHDCHSDSRQPRSLHPADLSQRQAASGHRRGSLDMQQ